MRSVSIHSRPQGVEARVEREGRSRPHAVRRAAHEVEQQPEHGESPGPHTGTWAERLAGQVRGQRMVDPDRPRQAARTAVELLVGVVAHPPDRLPQDQPGSDAVGDGEERQPHQPAGDPRAQHAADDRAVDAQAAAPDPERVHEDMAVRHPVGDDMPRSVRRRDRAGSRTRPPGTPAPGRVRGVRTAAASPTPRPPRPPPAAARTSAAGGPGSWKTKDLRGWVWRAARRREPTRRARRRRPAQTIAHSTSTY